MTPSELKAKVSETGSKFFERKTMKFFGDTMANYGVRPVIVETENGNVDAWELYRKKPVFYRLQSSAFFTLDFQRIHSQIAVYPRWVSGSRYKKCDKCGRVSIPGLIASVGLCQRHWNLGAHGVNHG